MDLKLFVANSARTAFIIAGLSCCAIIARAASPADTIATRQANFKQMGQGMKAIIDQTNAPTPDFGVIKAAAASIAQAAGKVDGYFPQGSGPQAGVKTGALPAIWEKPDEFSADTIKLITASAALRAAADSGNVEAVKTRFAQVGGTCKECHENFRAREN